MCSGAAGSSVAGKRGLIICSLLKDFVINFLCHKSLVVQYFSRLSPVCQGKDLLPGPAQGHFQLQGFGTDGYHCRGAGCGVSRLFPIVSLIQQGSLRVSLLSLLLKVEASIASTCQMSLAFLCSSPVSDANPFAHHHSPFMRSPAGSFAGKISPFKLRLELSCSLGAEVVC